MKFIDKVLRFWRVSKVLPYINNVATVLDIGCDDGYLLRKISGRITFGVGIEDPLGVPAGKSENLEFRTGYFPESFLPTSPENRVFSIITALAVIEHVPDEKLDNFLSAANKALCERGKFILTVPSPLVDAIVDFLVKIKLADGMSLEEHRGFDPNDLKPAFERHGFVLEKHETFQLGLNNLFVFRKGCVK